MRWLAIVAVALSLVGCAHADAPPVSRSELVVIVEQIRADAWNDASYASETQPVLEMENTLADSDWSTTAALCFSRAGYRVQQVDFTFVYESGLNQDYRAFALATYQCTNRHPRLGSLTSYLDEGGRAALYGYVQRVVHPCLQLAGERPDSLPTLTEFVDNGRIDPFAGLLAVGAARERLLQKCPPVPRWLSL